MVPTSMVLNRQDSRPDRCGRTARQEDCTGTARGGLYFAPASLVYRPRVVFCCGGGTPPVQAPSCPWDANFTNSSPFLYGVLSLPSPTIFLRTTIHHASPLTPPLYHPSCRDVVRTGGWAALRAVPWRIFGLSAAYACLLLPHTAFSPYMRMIHWVLLVRDTIQTTVLEIALYAVLFALSCRHGRLPSNLWRRTWFIGRCLSHHPYVPDGARGGTVWVDSLFGLISSTCTMPRTFGGRAFAFCALALCCAVLHTRTRTHIPVPTTPDPHLHATRGPTHLPLPRATGCVCYHHLPHHLFGCA